MACEMGSVRQRVDRIVVRQVPLVTRGSLRQHGVIGGMRLSRRDGQAPPHFAQEMLQPPGSFPRRSPGRDCPEQRYRRSYPRRVCVPGGKSVADRRAPAAGPTRRREPSATSTHRAAAAIARGHRCAPPTQWYSRNEREEPRGAAIRHAWRFRATRQDTARPDRDPAASTPMHVREV